LRRLLELSQYSTVRYSARLGEAEIVASVGPRGDNDENALAESFNGLYKTELIQRQVLGASSSTSSGRRSTLSIGSPAGGSTSRSTTWRRSSSNLGSGN
jgi:transposase InsO family protein